MTGLAAGEYQGIVAPGEYRVSHQPGFLADSSSGRPWPILLKEGERREFNVTLTRTHAIAVRVVDEWGEPLSGLSVAAQSVSGGGLSFERTTDDRGRVRVFGLTSGSYVVCADPALFAVPVRPASDRRREGFLRTCFPSATDESDAQPVPVARSDVGEIEIRMRRGRTFAVSGMVLDASGAPATEAMVSLTRFLRNGTTGMGVEIDRDGRFTKPNVHPGDYAIEAMLGGPDRPEQRRPLEAGFVPVRLDGSDVEDLVVRLTRTVEVSGHIALEDPTATLPAADGSGLIVTARLADDRTPGSGSLLYATVGEDRAFTVSGVFGRCMLEIDNVPRGWYVKSIRYGGREIVDEPTEFKAGRDAPAVEVLLSNRGAFVSGRAVDDIGNPVARAIVLLFSGTGTASIRVAARAVASADGAYRFGAVRYGDYAIVALPASASMLQYGDWQRVAQLAAAGERVTLGELDDRLVDVRVLTAHRD